MDSPAVLANAPRFAAAIDATSLDAGPEIETVMRGVGLQVFDHPVASDPGTPATRRTQPGIGGEQPVRVKVQALIPRTPAGPDRRALEYDGADSGTRQKRGH